MPEPGKDSLKEKAQGLGCGVLVLFVMAGMIYLTITLPSKISNLGEELLGTANPNKIIPSGNFCPVRVLSASPVTGSGKYRVTIQRFGTSGETDPLGLLDVVEGCPNPRIIYTLQCTARFREHCTEVVPESLYYARWVSRKHDQMAIGESDGTHIIREKIRIFDIKEWKTAVQLVTQ
jgi:hypothetical protein